MHSLLGAMHERAGFGVERASTGGERECSEGMVVYASTRVGRPPQRLEESRIENGELVGVKDGWVLFAVHPTKGRRVVREGIVLVDDERIVCGGTQQGFFAAPLLDAAKDQIRINATRPPNPDKIFFPNLFMLAPTLRQMAQDVVEVSQTGIGEVTYPLEVPRDESVIPGVDSRIVGQIYRSAKASAIRGEEPQLPEFPTEDTLPPGADVRAVAQVYRNVMDRAIRDAASTIGEEKEI